MEQQAFEKVDFEKYVSKEAANKGAVYSNSIPDSKQFSLTGLKTAGFYHFDIKGTETDCLDRLHISALLAMMQEAAYKNAETLGIGASYLDPQGICWLLSKISVRMTKLPRWLDNITVSTWSRGPRRLLFLRDFTFYSGGLEPENVIGHASSEWFLAGADSHRPLRPEQVIEPSRIKNHQQAPAVFDFDCPRLKNLDTLEESEPILVKYADFSDIDRNNHVNNTRYAAWAVDAVQAYLSGQTGDKSIIPMSISGFDIQYISEIFFGSKVDIFINKDDQGNFLAEGRLHDDGQVAFRCRIMLNEI